MKKPDILLIAPPTRAYSIHFSFALIYLSAFLEEKGFVVQIVDLRLSPSEGYTLEDLENLCVKQILSNDPKYLGFTCLTADYNCIDRIVRQLRKYNFKGKIIIGGHHPTFCPEDFFIEKGLYDYVVLGEGELTLFELLNCLEKNDDISKVDGIAYSINGKLQKTNPRRLVEDINTFPFPAYHLLDMNQYIKPTQALIRHILISGVPILTTRGCPFKCTYCGNPSLWTIHNYKKILRARAINLILDELELLIDKYKIDGFYIADDSFTITEERVKEFCEGLRSRKLGLIWGCQTHVNLFTENMARCMRDAGCIQIEFGVESGSNRILKEMNKGTNTDRIKRAFDICRKYKIRTLANLLINTPTETEADLDATISFGKKLKPTIYSFGVTVPLVGTEVYEKYVTPKLIRTEYSIYLDEKLYSTIVDKRFKLSSHNKNINWIYCYLAYRFIFLRYHFDAPIYFLKKYKFYKKTDKLGKYLNTILRKFFVLNRISQLANRFSKKT